MLQGVDNTRERILQIAEALVYEKGFSGTSLNDIVSAASLTKGAFFHHFRSKDDLGRALVARYARSAIAFRTAKSLRA